MLGGGALAVAGAVRPAKRARRTLRQGGFTGGGAGGAGDPRYLAAAAEATRRWAYLSAVPVPVPVPAPIGFLPAVSLTGALGGALCGIGVAVLLQQFAVAELTQSLLITSVVIGLLVGGLVLPSIGRAVAASRVNRLLVAASGRLPGGAPAGPGVVPAPSAGAAPAGAPAPAQAPAPAPASAPAPAALCRVPASGLPARPGPDPSAPVVAQLAPGLVFALVERRGDWAHLRAPNGWEGWVDGRLLEPAGLGGPGA
ncbi:MAG: SH3 domain-containing protein [Acidimicrobiales bacterium]|nr:SH3 domain-containing protein [Acidimicrobiales bacterium]